MVIQLSVRLNGTMSIGRFDLMFPRSGLEPTVRFDFCESTTFTNFVIKASYGMWNNNWSTPFTNFAINASYGILLLWQSW